MQKNNRPTLAHFDKGHIVVIDHLGLFWVFLGADHDGFSLFCTPHLLIGFGNFLDTSDHRIKAVGAAGCEHTTQANFFEDIRRVGQNLLGGTVAVKPQQKGNQPFDNDGVAFRFETDAVVARVEIRNQPDLALTATHTIGLGFVLLIQNRQVAARDR